LDLNEYLLLGYFFFNKTQFLRFHSGLDLNFTLTIDKTQKPAFSLKLLLTGIKISQ